jgi:hypothetical protein
MTDVLNVTDGTITVDDHEGEVMLELTGEGLYSTAFYLTDVQALELAAALTGATLRAMRTTNRRVEDLNDRVTALELKRGAVWIQNVPRADGDAPLFPEPKGATFLVDNGLAIRIQLADQSRLWVPRACVTRQR